MTSGLPDDLGSSHADVFCIDLVPIAVLRVYMDPQNKPS